jgi:flagellin-like protein
MKLSKRGVSPVIATVLLVALVLILASIVFIWAKSFISEQIVKNGKPVEQACKDVSFDIDYIKSLDAVELQLVNTGNVPIYDLDIKFIEGGSSSMKRFGVGADVGSSSDRKILPAAGITQIILYPMVLGKVSNKESTKAITCLDDGKVIAL